MRERVVCVYARAGGRGVTRVHNIQGRFSHVSFSLPSSRIILNVIQQLKKAQKQLSVIQSNNSHQLRPREPNCCSCCWASKSSTRNSQNHESHMVFSLPSSTTILNVIQQMKTPQKTNFRHSIQQFPPATPQGTELLKVLLGFLTQPTQQPEP